MVGLLTTDTGRLHYEHSRARENSTSVTVAERVETRRTADRNTCARNQQLREPFGKSGGIGTTSGSYSLSSRPADSVSVPEGDVMEDAYIFSTSFFPYGEVEDSV